MVDLVSVIMPAYNAEKYIAESIESVIAQTYTNWELIIVDDGSTDNTAKIVSNYVVLDTRIKYICQENQKQGIARNNGLKLSKGKFIAFLDSDDIWVADKLEIQLKCIEENRSDLVFSAGFVFSKDISVPDYEYNTILGELQGDNGFKSLLRRNFIPILSVLVTRQALIGVGGFDHRPEIQNVEDYHLWLKMLLKGFAFFGMSDRLFYYRQHKDQVTASDPCASEKVLIMLDSFLEHPVCMQSSIRQAILRRAKTWYQQNATTRITASAILARMAQIEQLRQFAFSTRIIMMLIGIRASKKFLNFLVHA